jgi:hypothetical protein
MPPYVLKTAKRQKETPLQRTVQQKADFLNVV